MKYKLLFISFAFLFSAQAQNIDNKIVIGKIDSVYSNIIGEQRKIWVYVPQGSDDPIFSKKHYPVVYLMDGDAHFYSVMGMIQQLSEVNGNTICPKMIVVGIPNTDRMERSYTNEQVVHLAPLSKLLFPAVAKNLHRLLKRN